MNNETGSREMERVLTTASLEAHVERLNVRYYGSVFRARVPEIERLLGGGKIVILDSYTADFEPRFRIGDLERPAGTFLIQLR